MPITLIDRRNIAIMAQRKLDERKRQMALKEDAERHLLPFVEMMWPAVEPVRKMTHGWVIEAIAEHLEAVEAGDIKRLCMNCPPGSMKSLMLNCFFPAWLWGPRRKPSMRFMNASYSVYLTERDNARFRRILGHPVYRKAWGDVFGQGSKWGDQKVENDKTGWKLSTSTSSVGTGERADGILLDDLNNPNDVESETVRYATNHWLREVMPDRLNDLSTGWIINIQQRTHEQDATGTLIEHGSGYTWLVIPMEFDPHRMCETVLKTHEDGSVDVWRDPRGCDENGDVLEGLTVDALGRPALTPGSPMALAEGELAWPERFSAEAVEEQKRIKGPYAYCNPAEAPVLMRDLSLKPIGDIKIGDEIIGFTTGEKRDAPGRNKIERHKLTPTTVLDISVSVRQVVKVTMASGETIRCTPDHKWYTARTERGRELYKEARVGSNLIRVCPPRLPVLGAEDLRWAGWLGGFFDGEGSVVVGNRRPGANGSALITFTQGTGRNGPLCDKLEAALNRFGFRFGFHEAVRQDREYDREGAAPSRTYYLKRGREHRQDSILPMHQHFMHIVQPSKWRERIQDGVLISRFISAKERVISIEPDGIETVYGLTTGTGNYVVWGLASSNSGQYLQVPGVRGGEIIRHEWWLPWEQAEFPPFGTVIASLDTALKEHEEADYNAITVWGAFPSPHGNLQIMLKDAWRDRMPLAKLVERVAMTCREHKVDYLLIEDKTRGHDVAGEILRLYKDATWQTALVKPVGDKVSRANSVSHMWSGDLRIDRATGTEIWSGGVIYAPMTERAEEVIKEFSSFPRGAHDDYVDSGVQAIAWMRQNGVLLRRPEYDEIETEKRRYRKGLSVPYSIR